MATLTEQLNNALKRIEKLENTVRIMRDNNEEGPPKPYTKSGKPKNAGQYRPSGIRSGSMGSNSGFIIWNKQDEDFPPYGTAPRVTYNPDTYDTTAYNRHSHSRLSGGPLDIDTLELIAYNWDTANPTSYNRDSQAFWKETPYIKTSSHADGDTGAEGVEKVGKLDIHFDGDSQKWVAGGGSISYLYPTWLAYT